MKAMYQRPVVVVYACEEESAILVGSIIVNDQTVVEAVGQEKGVVVDMRENNFSHEWN